jgi:hypothetical protein
MRNSWEKEEVHTGFCWGNLRGRDRFEYVGEGWMIILKQICKKKNGVWPGLVWFKLGITY